MLSDVQLLYAMEYNHFFINRRLEFESEKSGKIECDNVIIYFLCRQLAQDFDVIKFDTSIHKFKFYNPKRDKSSYAKFTLDVIRKDKKQLFYVTTVKDLFDPVEDAIIEAADAHADHVGQEFKLITEIEVFGNNPEYMKSVVPYILNVCNVTFTPEPFEKISQIL